MLAPTLRFRRRHLPHWEVAGARYFVTVRCADSLPPEAVARIAELHRLSTDLAPQSPQFAAHQRRIFATLEKYLDAGTGACPLRRPAAARILIEEFESLADWGIAVPHFTIMPNHWHAVLVPAASEGRSLTSIMKRLKGRTGNRLRKIIGGRGPVWQGEWFDRWVRDEAEWQRTVAYIRNNPVKAGIARAWTDHPWTR
jgi:REP element-mobilizing transposase RayT